MENHNHIEISIVIPLLNEEENLRPIFDAIASQMNTVQKKWELIFIDDGSSDNSLSVIKGLSEDHKEVKGISFSRNFGQYKAMLAGMSFASGNAIITMDSDLQHPPSLLGDLIKQWDGGYQIVQTKRIDSEDFGFVKRMLSKVFHKVFSLLSGIKMEPGVSDFRLMDKAVVAEILKMNDYELFFRGISYWVGFQSTLVSFQAENRLHGDTKWNLKKNIRYSAGALLSFSIIPLKLGIWIGLVTACLSFAEIIYIFIQYLNGETIPGWASTLTIISFMFGILFILLGVIGSYLGRIYETLKNRPKYIISNKVGFD